MTNPANLPVKPNDVAHVTDEHWEAALKAAFDPFKQSWDNFMSNWMPSARLAVIDHARALILLGEVEEPMDPLDVAIEAFFNDGKQFDQLSYFRRACHRYFAGMTFPEKTS